MTSTTMTSGEPKSGIGRMDNGIYRGPLSVWCISPTHGRDTEMDIIIWTDDASVSAKEVTESLTRRWARSVRIYFRPSGELLDEYIYTDGDDED